MTVAKLKRLLEQCNNPAISGLLIEAHDLASLIRLALAAREPRSEMCGEIEYLYCRICGESYEGGDMEGRELTRSCSPHCALIAVLDEGDDHAQ